ncbi:MAG: hypothetical protein LBU85_07200 [Treponema sp.]|nr:hypothetical protein [Treponema sp.]
MTDTSNEYYRTLISLEEARLYIYNWPYYIPDSIIEKEYKVRVIYDEFKSNEEMFARIKAGGSGYDIVFPSGDYVAIMIQQGMLTRIDKARLANLRNIRPEIYAEFVDAFNFPAAVNIPARQYKTGDSWYSVEDLANTEIMGDPGPALALYNDAWFGIREK